MTAGRGLGGVDNLDKLKAYECCRYLSAVHVYAFICCISSWAQSRAAFTWRMVDFRTFALTRPDGLCAFLACSSQKLSLQTHLDSRRWELNLEGKGLSRPQPYSWFLTAGSENICKRPLLNNCMTHLSCYDFTFFDRSR